MTEFVALRPKLYFYKKLDGSEDNKCKGIKKCVVQVYVPQNIRKIYFLHKISKICF